MEEYCKVNMRHIRAIIRRMLISYWAFNRVVHCIWLLNLYISIPYLSFGRKFKLTWILSFSILVAFHQMATYKKTRRCLAEFLRPYVFKTNAVRRFDEFYHHYQGKVTVSSWFEYKWVKTIVDNNSRHMFLPRIMQTHQFISHSI